METLRSYLSKDIIILGFIAVLFVLIRLPGTHLPLHQDEYKWPQIANPAIHSETEIPHPPLSQFIYQTAGKVVGYDTDFRLVPLFFAVLNLILLYAYLTRKFGRSTALVGACILTVCYYSVLASLMVDTDGQILPFFFLVALIAYERLKTAPTPRLAALSAAVLALACIGGFLVKVSFILAIGALAADYVLEHLSGLSFSALIKYALVALSAGVVLVFVLLLAQWLFPFFNLETSLAYWEHFANTRHNWFQTAIQLVKALLYVSPLMAAAPLLLRRFQLPMVRVHLLYLLFGALFYLVIFDFSIGALDRYLQFIIIPLTVILSVVLVEQSASISKRDMYRYAAIGLGIGIIVALMSFLPQFVPSLYPKSAWIGRMLGFKWNFLYPFSGGSGPLTFYVSFAVLGITWILTGAFVVWALFKRSWQPYVLALIVPLSFTYSALFTEEYLFGAINGSASDLVQSSAAFIRNDPDIKKVVVYNDNGGNEIQQTGKYEKRLYTSPDFSVRDKAETMNAFSGHYLVIDAPPIDPNSVYARYFATCKPVFSDSSRYMHATVLDCRDAPKIDLSTL